MKYLLVVLFVTIPLLACAGEREYVGGAPWTEQSYREDGVLHIVISGFMAQLFAQAVASGEVHMNITNVGTGAPGAAMRASGANTAPAQTGGAAPPLDLVSMDNRNVESNPTWTKVAWRATVRNPADIAQSGWLDVELYDSAGFVIDSHPGGPVHLAPGEQRDYSDYLLLDADIRDQVRQIAVTLKTR